MNKKDVLPHKKLDFIKYVAEYAISSADRLVPNWLPDGKREGREWACINPSRNDKTARSFSINLVTGQWADFATDDKGGDLVSLLAYLEKCDQLEAAIRVADELALNIDHFVRGSTAPPPPLRGNKKGSARNAGGAYKAIMPVPDNCLGTFPTSHPKLGKPSQVWRYLDESSRLLMAVWRFETETENGRKKEYRPLSFGPGNKPGKRWNWKQPAQARPLYGLDRLAAMPDAGQVIICEGEKAADAAQRLFPDSPCITWAGGGKAIDKTDWQALEGRQVVFWPDNDAPGMEAATRVKSALEAVNGTLLGLVNLDSFARYKPVMKNGKAALNEGGIWKAKDDAADALNYGWQAAHIELLEARQELLAEYTGKPDTKSESRATSIPGGGGGSDIAPQAFRVAEDGLWFWSHKREMYLRAGDWLKLVGVTRSKEGSNFGILVHFRDVDGHLRDWNIPARLLIADSSADVLRALADKGYKIESPREARQQLIVFLNGYRDEERITLTDKMGWYDGAFMLPDRVIGNPPEKLRYHTDAPTPCKMSVSGSLAEWQEHIGRYCIDNHFLAFGVAAAFAAPLHEVIGEETTGLHYYGDSSLGKSTITCLAASICGNPKVYTQSWRATDNALEATAAAYSDCPLILDEIGQADGRIVGDVVYMLGNEQGKARASDRGSLGNPRHRWRLLFLSNGEHNLETYMAQAGRKIKAGQKMRLLSINANPHNNTDDMKRMGCYHNLHGYEHGSVLSNVLVAATEKYHGTAMIDFLEKLVPEANNKKLINWIEGKRKDFIAHHLSEEASGQAHRAAGKFALVGVAGELAIKWGVLAWPKGEALRAADTCFKDWLNGFGGEGSAENRELLAHIRLALQKYGESRFTRWDSEDPKIDTHQPRTAEMWGFYRMEEDNYSADCVSTERIFYIYPEIWKQEICKGLNATRAAMLLAEIGALEKNKTGRGLQKKVRLPGAGRKTTNVYVVKSGALFTTDDSGDKEPPGVDEQPEAA